MRRLALAPLSVLVGGSLLLAGCGGSSSSSSQGSTASGSAAASAAPSSAASAGASSAATPQPSPSCQTPSVAPTIGTSSTVAAKASGSYGDKPTLTFSGKPASTLGVQVLKQGTGKVVAKGDLLEADYLGQVWGGKVFDNSYDRGAAAAFPIGVGQVVAGWDRTLVGQKVGSRVLLSLPPSQGYACGNDQAGIKATDTIAFVVDIVDAFDKSAAGQATAAPQTLPSGAPTVKGDLGKPATITLPTGWKPPTTPRVSLLAKGTGPAVTGTVIVNYAAVETGGKSESSWADGTPQSIDTTNTSAAPFDQLKGLPVGSRVLVEVPADASSGRSAAAFVLDLIAVPTSAKKAAASAK
ncbi:FKBP-type peptidyl-prolyl cis-trans isomerase [Motilibacter rhizosphaerae]|uniref:FKBP-type peptidyl-prolyl cis-trans isomerase n=1 Tax=Motilibacter rhizosphaerae TaxID=598652 RepID=UPI00102BE436|nr:FKBP-type peptidyl-prolyl cis-trans isomerase [Motilibacter rhizosphaerae]